MAWGRVENETPKQTSDRITKSMQDNAKKAAEQAKKKK